VQEGTTSGTRPTASGPLPLTCRDPMVSMRTKTTPPWACVEDIIPWKGATSSPLHPHSVFPWSRTTLPFTPRHIGTKGTPNDANAASPTRGSDPRRCQVTRGGTPSPTSMTCPTTSGPFRHASYVTMALREGQTTRTPSPKPVETTPGGARLAYAPPASTTCPTASGSHPTSSTTPTAPVWPKTTLSAPTRPVVAPQWPPCHQWSPPPPSPLGRDGTHPNCSPTRQRH
jgi:hypothetical protein